MKHVMTMSSWCLCGLLAAACSNENLPGECLTDQDCGANEICLAGQCQEDVNPTCTSDVECGNGMVCNQGVCEAACTADAVCAAGTWCSAGRCVPGCRSDTDCSAGMTCNLTTHACGSTGCTSDAQCAAGQHCLNGQCVTGGCTSDAQCAAGQTCVNGTCQTGGGCSSDVDCPSGQSCVNGTCQPTTGCTSDVDCLAGQRCVGGQCVTGGCTSNADCLAGQTCVNGTCTGGGGCITDNDCAAGQTCINGTCTGSGGCTNDSDCQAGQTCVNGVCTTTAECTTSADCSWGQVCNNGVCESSGGCLTDADCQPGEQCILFQCFPATGCTTDDDCASGEVCDNGTCVAAPACDLLTNDCPANQHCAVFSDGSTGCVDNGAGSACAAGNYDDCPGGQLCIGFGNAYACYTVCDTADGSPCGADEQCYDLGVGGAGVCTPKPECDPLLQDCPDPGTRCVIGETGVAVCAAAGDGSECYNEVSDDCPVGMTCIDVGSWVDCMYLCDPASGQGCASGQTCTEIDGMGGYGVCDIDCHPLEQDCSGYWDDRCSLSGGLPTCDDGVGSGSSCQAGDGDDCTYGSLCVDFRGETGCHSLCNVYNGIGCTAPEECMELTNVRQWGVCLDNSCQTTADCQGQVCLNQECVPCTTQGAPACETASTCNPTTGWCDLNVTQDVTQPCGWGYGACLGDLLCLGYEGQTPYCYEACVPNDDPFCQPGNSEVCVTLGTAQSGYCDFGGGLAVGDDCSGTADSCAAGALCLTDSWSGDSNCFEMCDYWDDNPGCSSGWCRNLGDTSNPDLGYCD